MTITDINGCEITITDLDQAIEKAEYFKNCEHIPPVPSDRERQAYWLDMYNKLIALKNKNNEQPDR